MDSRQHGARLSDRIALVGLSPSVYQQYAKTLRAAAHTEVAGPDFTFQATLLIGDLATGKVLSERPVTIQFGEPIAWSPDGNFVFVIRNGSHLTAYDATSSDKSGRDLVVRDSYSTLIVQR